MCSPRNPSPDGDPLSYSRCPLDWRSIPSRGAPHEFRTTAAPHDALNVETRTELQLPFFAEHWVRSGDRPSHPPAWAALAKTGASRTGH